jgi:beta-aspartyl-peptidase (threonine type)
MKKSISLFVLLLSIGLNAQQYAIIIHGGAGNGLHREGISEDQEAAYLKSLNRALAVGDSALKANTPALEVVNLVIQVMENDSLFNAGKGAVLTYDAIASLDASIMDGKSGEAGAVAGISCIKNPIAAALAVLNHSSHVMLSGEGADEFSKTQGLNCVDPSYFLTKRHLNTIKRIRKETGAVDLDSIRDFKMGTVGCVVRDREGNIAAGTSTGGMMAKRFGRIGDSPIIGAGTFADNETVGISCTGHGEYFIRHAVAYQMSARFAFLNETGQQAADEIVHNILSPRGGAGGLIGIDAEGEFIVSFNTRGMLRGWLREGSPAETHLFGMEQE